MSGGLIGHVLQTQPGKELLISITREWSRLPWRCSDSGNPHIFQDGRGGRRIAGRRFTFIRNQEFPWKPKCKLGGVSGFLACCLFCHWLKLFQIFFFFSPPNAKCRNDWAAFIIFVNEWFQSLPTCCCTHLCWFRPPAGCHAGFGTKV